MRKLLSARIGRLHLGRAFGAFHDRRSAAGGTTHESGVGVCEAATGQNGAGENRGHPGPAATRRLDVVVGLVVGIGLIERACGLRLGGLSVGGSTLEGRLHAKLSVMVLPDPSRSA